MSPKIYVACFPAPNWGEESVVGYALAEDGQGLVSHLSSSPEFSKHDMGFNSDWHHDTYKTKYPDGFEVVWVDDPDNDPDWIRATQLNSERAGEK